MPNIVNQLETSENPQNAGVIDITLDDLESDPGCCSGHDDNSRPTRDIEIVQLPIATIGMTCPSCRTFIKTRRRHYSSIRTHIAAFFFCGIPYCCHICQDTYHYCPVCGVYIGASFS